MGPAAWGQVSPSPRRLQFPRCTTAGPRPRYFLTRNQSSLVAFAVGGNVVPGSPVSIVAAHTDSPCLKVKPTSAQEKEGYL